MAFSLRLPVFAKQIRPKVLSFRRELPPLQRRLVLSGVIIFLIIAALTCFTVSLRYDDGAVWNFKELFAAMGKLGSFDSGLADVSRRITKTCAMVLAVSAIGVGGLIMQGITRNDLASPELMGMTGAAKLGLTILAFQAPTMALAGKYAVTMVAAALPVCILMLASNLTKRKPSGLTMAFAGIALGIVFSSIEWFVMYNNQEGKLFVQGFLNDKFGDATVTDLRFFSGFIVAPMALVAVLSRRFTLLDAGTELATSVGSSANLTRSIGLVAVVIMVPAAMLVGANLLLVGVAVPHAAKLLLRTKNYAVLGLGTIAVGVILISLANLVTSYAHINIGGLMAIIAAPAFILLARRMRA